MRDTFSNFNEMLDCVQERGFLPFFTNEIPQFSIEELCPSELWYHDTGFENGTTAVGGVGMEGAGHRGGRPRLRQILSG